MRRLAPVVMSLLLAAACAGRPAPSTLQTPAAPPVSPSALIAAGCYRCLEDAYAAASTADRAVAFEAAILLALRSKELGLPAGPWLQRAREIAPVGEDWAAYLEIALTFPRDPLADDRSVLMDESAEQRRPRATYELWQSIVRTGAGSAPLRSYLELAIGCRPDVWGSDTARARDDAAGRVSSGEAAATPLLQYRVGLCGGRGAAQLAEARAAEPRLVDAELELGRRELQRQPRPDVPEAFRRLGLAAAAFPESPVIRATLARLHESREQWAEALAEWDGVLAVVPGHGDALMGRTIVLSQLLRHEEAILTATTAIDVAPTHRSTAYYWRSWNEFRLTQLDAARADADAAKALSVNAPLFLLSGMIEWEMKRPESAEKEFLETLIVDLGYCEAASYLGGVRLELRKWPESLAAFEQARNCYQLSMTVRRTAITALSATPEDSMANAFEIGGHQRALAAAERRHAEALQNIAALQKFLTGTR